MFVKRNERGEESSHDNARIRIDAYPIEGDIIRIDEEDESKIILPTSSEIPIQSVKGREEGRTGS